MILFAAFRYKIGTDYINYEYIFEITPPLNNLELSDFVVEPFTVLMVGVLKLLFPDFVAVKLAFAVFSILTITVIFKAAKRLTISHKSLIYFPVLYLGFFYLQANFNVIRFGLAASLLLLAISYLHDKKSNLIFLCVLLALFVHYASLLILPVIYLTNKTYKISTLIIIYLSGIILYFFGVFDYVVMFAVNHLSSFNAVNYYFVDVKNEKYGISYGFLTNSIIFISSLFLISDRKASRQDFLLRNMMCFALFLYLTLNSYYVLIERMLLLFNVSFLLYIARFPYVSILRFGRLSLFSYGVIILIYALSSFGSQLSTEGIYRQYQYYPYESFVFK